MFGLYERKSKLNEYKTALILLILNTNTNQNTTKLQT